MSKKAKNINGANWPLLGSLSFIIFLIIHLIFNDLGLIKMFQLQSKKERLQTEIKDLKSKIDEKNQEIYALENNYEYIEKIAREKYKMVKKGEKVYRVRDVRSIKNILTDNEKDKWDHVNDKFFIANSLLGDVKTLLHERKKMIAEEKEKNKTAKKRWGLLNALRRM